MRQTISVKFFARKDRAIAEGMIPISMRIGINRQRINIVTKIHVKESEWSSAEGKLKSKTRESQKMNDLLDGFRVKAFDCQRELMNEGKPITLENIKAKWFGTSLEYKVMLMEVFKQHNEEMKALVNKEFSPLTLERYETSFRHTMEFMKWKYNVCDIEVKELKYEFISGYEFWLKSVRNCDHNTSMKYLSNFKKIVHICLKNGWLNRDPFVGFKLAKREIERPFLVEEELTRIIDKDFQMLRLRQVRDIFVFCCYTGLAYADVEKLTREEITTGIDGEKWIWTSRQKTDTTTRLPLLPPALEILDRYKENPQCSNKGKLLPVLSNQKMNSYLKEIADACGISKKMTFHTARHTFATTVTLTNGVPIETVSKMLGHRNLKTTQHYAKILDKKVSEDMMELRNRLETTDFKLENRLITLKFKFPMNASMKIKVLKNRTGMVSGVVIPTEELHEVKESIKQNTELYKVITKLLKDQPNNPETDIVLSHGKTIAETESDALVLTRALYADAFSKGVPMFYRDKRVQHSNEFVRANPDGSEDLVSFHSHTRSYTLIKNLAPAGKGYWADLISR